MTFGPAVERAGPAHASWLAAVHHAAFAPPDAWSVAAFAGQLALPGVLGLMHHAGGLVLARVAADEAEILTLAVVPESTRRGVARALLQAAHDAAAAAGALACFLEVSETNLGARALYDQLGYRLAGRRRGYYRQGADALVLRVNLHRGVSKAP